MEVLRGKGMCLLRMELLGFFCRTKYRSLLPPIPLCLKKSTSAMTVVWPFPPVAAGHLQLCSLVYSAPILSLCFTPFYVLQNSQLFYASSGVFILPCIAWLPIVLEGTMNLSQKNKWIPLSLAVSVHARSYSLSHRQFTVSVFHL